MNVRISGTLFLLTFYYQSVISESNFGDYYRAYPIVPMTSANLYYQMVKDDRNKNPHNFYSQQRLYAQSVQPEAYGSSYSNAQNIPQSSYWPPSIINTRPADKLALLNRVQFDVPSVQDQQQTQLQGLINGISLALINAITSALIPRNQQYPTVNQFGQPFGGLPLINSIPTASISLGPSQQYGYGVNAGVYAGLQSSQSGYNYNYNTNPNNRPYGPTNTNVGGSYSGLSPWPFVSTNGENGSVNSSTLPRPQPTQSTTTSAQENRPVAEVQVRTIPIQDLIESTAQGL